jgi:hypothetical protein
VGRTAVFWYFLLAGFCKGLDVCGTTKLSGALWVGLGLKSEYLESPEVAAAAKSLIRPARYLLLANSLLATWEFVLWIICTAEDLCSLSGSRALQVGIITGLGASALLFASIVCVRTWRPLKLGPLYIAEWGLAIALLQMIVCALYLMIAASGGRRPTIGEQPSVASQVCTLEHHRTSLYITVNTCTTVSVR